MSRFVQDFIEFSRPTAVRIPPVHMRDFVLHATPQVDLASGRVVAAEIAIRLRDIEDALREPQQLGPLVRERDGLLPAIGAWALREAVAATANFRAIRPSFRIWVNVSGSELCDPNWLEGVLRHGDALRGIGVDVTEDAALRDLEGTLRTFSALKDAGVSIALDDFGTGNPSLPQLKQLPVDVVKLDRALTLGVHDDERERQMVSAILSMGRGLGFETVAEGIESAGQLRALRDEGCRFGQGDFFGRPIPVADLHQMLLEQSFAP
jgi:EAL domain-containing protein (putative c-di-GMP-specific phosphodiesterase class I)